MSQDHPASEGWRSVTRFRKDAFDLLRADGYAMGPDTPFNPLHEVQRLERLDGGKPEAMSRDDFIRRYMTIEWVQG